MGLAPVILEARTLWLALRFRRFGRERLISLGGPAMKHRRRVWGISCADCPPPRAWPIGAPIVRMFSLGICGRLCPIMLPIPWRWRFPHWSGIPSIFQAFPRKAEDGPLPPPPGLHPQQQIQCHQRTPPPLHRGTAREDWTAGFCHAEYGHGGEPASCGYGQLVWKILVRSEYHGGRDHEHQFYS